MHSPRANLNSTQRPPRAKSSKLTPRLTITVNKLKRNKSNLISKVLMARRTVRMPRKSLQNLGRRHRVAIDKMSRNSKARGNLSKDKRVNQSNHLGIRISSHWKTPLLVILKLMLRLSRKQTKPIVNKMGLMKSQT